MRTVRVVPLLLIALAASLAAGDAMPPVPDAGLVVQVGGSGLDLAKRIAGQGRCVVARLVDAGAVDGLRRDALAAGLGGVLVIDALPADGRLPFPDRFVTLLIAEAGAPAEAELRRVVAVDGALARPGAGGWTQERAPRDARLGEWTHKWHDHTGNPVSADRVAGPPALVQWQHGPAMGDGTADGKVPRIAGGRIVHVDSLNGDLVCRDAGNGLLRWRQALNLPYHAELAVAGDRVYVHRGQAPARNGSEVGPLLEIDLATGAELRRFEKGPAAAPAKGKEQARPWFVVVGDSIVLASGATLAVLDRRDAGVRWQVDAGAETWGAPIVLGDRVIAPRCAQPARRARMDGTPALSAVAAFALADGKPLWTRADAIKAGRNVFPLVGDGDRVLLCDGTYQSRVDGAAVVVLDAATGATRWTAPVLDHSARWTNTDSSARALLRGGDAWYLGSGGVMCWDAATGAPRGDFRKRPQPGIKNAKFRGDAACAHSYASAAWLVANCHQWWGADGACTLDYGMRGPCGSGLVPANGLVYALPTACDCTDLTRGYLAAAPGDGAARLDDAARLTAGAAAAATPAPAAGEWPAFLADAGRTAATAAALPAQLTERWRVRAAAVADRAIDRDRRQSEYWLGPLGAPVAAAGLVLVPLTEEHAVVALDAASGKERWRAPLGGRAATPPTIAAGLAVVGAGDGTVSALRLADGQPAWRFRAAPTRTAAMLHGHLASAWPVGGAVPVIGDRVLAVAGIHTHLGGLHLWSLDLRTGAPHGVQALVDGAPAGAEVPVADGDGLWIGAALRAPVAGAAPAPASPIRFDRGGAELRFNGAGRGGSTHGWAGASLRAHRTCFDGALYWQLYDQAGRPGTALALRCTEAPYGKEPRWSRTVAELKRPGGGALIKAGTRLYLGGGDPAGGAGFVLVLSAADGALVQEIAVPARVAENGLAAAGGRLLVSLENGEVACFGE